MRLRADKGAERFGAAPLIPGDNPQVFHVKHEIRGGTARHRASLFHFHPLSCRRKSDGHRHVIGWFFPIPSINVNLVVHQAILQCRRDPDVIQPPSPVALAPIRAAIAPPRKGRFVVWDEVAGGVGPVQRLLQKPQTCRLRRCVRDNLQKLLVVPHIRCQGATLKSPANTMGSRGP